MSSYEFHAGGRQSIAFTFDEQQQFLSKAMALYESVKMVPPFKEHSVIVESIEKGKDDVALPLQAADMLAGQIRLFLTSPRPKGMSPYMEALKSKQRFSYNHVFDAPQLLEVAHNVQRWSGRW
jgi:hypothetical protein